MVKEIQIDVEPKQLSLIKKILKRHIAYKTVWAYGSRVNWTANQYSDLDLVVFEVNTVKLGELKEVFAESDLPFTVDIMSWEKIPEDFKNKIRKKYVVLQKKPELEGWEEYILEDVIDKFIDYRGKTPRKLNSGIPLVTAKIVKAGRIQEPNEFISAEDYDSWMTRGLPEIDDIVLTTEAPLGEIA